MFDLESSFREWRKTARRCGLSSTELDELEDHLHCTYLAHRERGAAPGAAFATALRSLGAVQTMSLEYRKVRSLTWQRLLHASWVAFAAAFFLPVAHGGITLFDLNLSEGLLPGFEAIRVALEEGGWCALSAFTNALMLATMWRPSALTRVQVSALAAAGVASTLLNGWWLTTGISDLGPGYFLWFASFGLASAGLVMRARALLRGSIRALLA